MIMDTVDTCDQEWQSRRDTLFLLVFIVSIIILILAVITLILMLIGYWKKNNSVTDTESEMKEMEVKYSLGTSKFTDLYSQE